MTTAQVVDRQATTPFLIRIFSSHGNFHRLDDFAPDRQPRNELNLYSWKDATLGELTTLLAKELVGDSDRPISSYKFSYRLVYGDNNRGRYLTRDIGTVQTSQASRDSDMTLEEARFVVGDWLDIAVLQPGDRLYEDRSYDRDQRHSGNFKNQSRGGGSYRGNNSGSYRGGNNYRPYNERSHNGNSYRGDGYSRRSPDSHRGADSYRPRR